VLQIAHTARRPTWARGKSGGDFARAAANYYGAVDASPQSGTIYLSKNGIQFVYGRRVNALGRIVGEEQQIFIRPDEIVHVETDSERVVRASGVLLGGVAGLAGKSVASLAVELSDGRVAMFGLQEVTSPQLIGALSRFGLYRRKDS
jgi:hypothetical protein